MIFLPFDGTTYAEFYFNTSKSKQTVIIFCLLEKNYLFQMAEDFPENKD